MKNIAIFGSGNGSNAENIIKYFKSHQNISVKIIVSEKHNAKIIDIAKKWKLDTLIIPDKFINSTEDILKKTNYYNINFIVLAGFLIKVPEKFINSFPKSIINIHPSLLPKFGGKGMYGINVHKAVLDANDKETGITIHYVNKKFDEGKIIFQAKCQVLKNDSPTSLAKRVQKLEHQFYPLIIEKIINHGN
tara:strand:- start:898 stop:1470 length:573 start_codon:yes stop_codon:yes gene_type:complete